MYNPPNIDAGSDDNRPVSRHPVATSTGLPPSSDDESNASEKEDDDDDGKVETDDSGVKGMTKRELVAMVSEFKFIISLFVLAPLSKLPTIVTSSKPVHRMHKTTEPAAFVSKGKLRETISFLSSGSDTDTTTAPKQRAATKITAAGLSINVVDSDVELSPPRYGTRFDRLSEQMRRDFGDLRTSSPEHGDEQVNSYLRMPTCI
jgi:hypothetical protein